MAGTGVACSKDDSKRGKIGEQEDDKVACGRGGDEMKLACTGKASVGVDVRVFVLEHRV